MDIIYSNQFYKLVEQSSFQTLPLELRHSLILRAIDKGLIGEKILYNYDLRREQTLCNLPSDNELKMLQMSKMLKSPLNLNPSLSSITINSKTINLKNRIFLF